MKKVRVEDAIGLTLGHDVTVARKDFKGVAFHRGHIIEEKDIPALLDIGKKHIFIWEADTDDIHEEDAARRLAAMCEPANVSAVGPSEGKIVFKAQTPGFFRVNTPLLKAINGIGDITICSLPDHYPVSAGQSLAAMRIVPLATKEEQIARAEALCREATLFAFKPYHHRKAGVIITGSEVYTGRIKDRFEPVIRAKLAQYPCEIIGVTICDDDLNMIHNAAQTHLDNGADFLIFTGGMSVDPDDLTPTAVRDLGAEIITHGVPAQPGNMTLVAYLGEVPILGVPGAAINMPTTVFDVLLPQIFAGDRLEKEELTQLGDGGLCQRCPSCAWPNCTFGKY